MAPQKLCLLLNLGSLLVLGSFAALKGPAAYLATLLTTPGYTLAYFGSILLSLYVSLIRKSYLLTLPAMALETVLLLYFVCASFPGGHAGLNYLGSTLWALVKAVVIRK